MNKLIALLPALLLAGCSIDEFDGKLFCNDKKAYVITWKTGSLYWFQPTPVANSLCEAKP